MPPRELCTDNAAMIASAARWVEPLPFPDYLGLDAYATRRAAARGRPDAPRRAPGRRAGRARRHLIAIGVLGDRLGGGAGGKPVAPSLVALSPLDGRSPREPAGASSGCWSSCRGPRSPTAATSTR